MDTGVTAAVRCLAQAQVQQEAALPVLLVERMAVEVAVGTPRRRLIVLAAQEQMASCILSSS